MTQNILRNSRIAVVFAAIVLISTAGAPIVAAEQQVIGQPNIDVSVQNPHVTPGEETTLELYLTNSGQIRQSGPSEYVDRVTTARGTTLDFNAQNSPIDIKTKTIPAGHVGPGTSGPFQVKLTVPEDVSAGTYEVPVNVKYSYTSIVNYGSGQPEFVNSFHNSKQTITIQVEEDARFDVVETNATAQVGDTGDISFTLQNTGSEIARQASVSAESKSSSLTFESGDTTSTTAVGDWEPGEKRTITYSAALESGSPVRGYTLDLTVNYEDNNGISRTSDPITTTVQSIPEQSFAFSDVSSSLRVGEDGAITGTIKNTGPKPVRSVVIQPVKNSATVIPSEDSTAVGMLSPGESKSFRLPMEITSEAEAGKKLLNVDVQYRDEDGNKQTYDKLDLLATIEQSRNTFGLDITNRTIPVGSTQVISVEVTNNLNETVTDIEARLFADTPLEVAGSDTSYVESLQPGESTTLTFKVAATGSATPQSSYPISFDFRYTDSDGNTHLSDTFKKPLDAVKSSGGGPPVIPILGVTVIVLGGAAIIYWRRS